jgi:FkbH-like protein
MVRIEHARHTAAASLTHEAFLASLALTVTLQRDDPVTLQRVTQLINKTNQFNLTTIRRSENEVAALFDSGQHSVYAASVDDRFGSYGLVGVAVVDWQADIGVIDTLLLSCRVLKRGIETSLLAAVARDAEKRGTTSLLGRFAPTAKNQQVAEFYPAHGFTAVGDGRFEMHDLTVLQDPEHIMRVDA